MKVVVRAAVDGAFESGRGEAAQPLERGPGPAITGGCCKELPPLLRKVFQLIRVCMRGIITPLPGRLLPALRVKSRPG